MLPLRLVALATLARLGTLIIVSLRLLASRTSLAHAIGPLFLLDDKVNKIRASVRNWRGLTIKETKNIGRRPHHASCLVSCLKFLNIARTGLYVNQAVDFKSYHWLSSKPFTCTCLYLFSYPPSLFGSSLLYLVWSPSYLGSYTPPPLLETRIPDIVFPQ